MAYIHHILCMHASDDGHVGCLHLFEYYKNVTSTFVFTSPGSHTPRSRTAATQGNSTLNTGGSADCFPKRLHRLHPHQLWSQVPISPGFRQHSLLPFDHNHPHRWDAVFHCVLSCLSLMVSDEEHLFMLLLAICMYAVEKCRLKSTIHFLKIDLLVFT